ncbi:MAG: Crp/Fnr family transcriptional regulator [Kiritimatiellia bacterium]|nr:Crp/Fnr family transcriptional regulator [Kiritimatiellia bacterium]
MKNNPDLTAILSQAHFFRGLADSSRQALAAIAIPRGVPKNECLFREGEPGHSVYLLARGRAELFKTTPGGEEVVITVIRPGQVFAEIVLFEKDRFPVTARTLTECNIYLFPRRDIRGLLSGEAFRNDFLTMMFAKQRHLTEQILQMTYRDLEARLFLFLKDQYGDDPEIRIDLSKRSVAAALRTTPESLSRLLKKLAGEERLIWTGKILRRPLLKN